MHHPFKVGQSYAREKILPILGSKQLRSGIVYGSAEPALVAAFTGSRHSTSAGYLDHWNDDGSFSYCGQGTTGDQQLTRPNSILIDPLRTVLLFKTWYPPRTSKGKNRFLGEHLVAGHHWESGQGTRSEDQLLIVTLVPARSPIDNAVQHDASPADDKIDLEELRQRAIDASCSSTPSQISTTAYRTRSDRVAEYAHARARGKCEMCGWPAPFVTPKGKPYLEIHHILRLADDGPDNIFHVAAICPNCHRKAHHGVDPRAFQDTLKVLIEEKERQGSPSQSED